MVELVDECRCHVCTLAVGLARLRVDVVAADGVRLARLSRQMTVGAIVAATVGEADDDAETVGRGDAVEAGIPILMEVGHDIRLIGLQALVVESEVLHEEIVEAGVCVERVEFVDEIVDVYVLPTLFEVGLFAQELDSPPFDVEVDCHAHHSIVANGMLVVQVLKGGHGDMLSKRSEPSLGVLSVLPRHVHVVLLVARSTCEDAHQLYSLADFDLDLCRRGLCGEEDKEDGKDFSLHYFYSVWKYLLMQSPDN